MADFIDYSSPRAPHTSTLDTHYTRQYAHEFQRIRTQELKLSVQELARALQVNHRTVEAWENGELKIPGPARVLVRLMRKYRKIREELASKEPAGD